VIWLIAPEAVFLVCAGLFLFAAYIIGWLTTGFGPLPGERTQAMGFIAATRTKSTAACHGNRPVRASSG